MTKTYTVRERMVAARPRSKRLRMLGGATSTGTSSVSYSSWEGSGGGGGSTFTLTITNPSAGVVSFNDQPLDFSHNHDWGEIANKPNLLEGVVIGKNKISFLHSNGDMVVASFSSINTRVADLEHWKSNPQGAAQAIEDLQTDVGSLVTAVASLQTDVPKLTLKRGMVIDPYVWGPSSGAEDWTNCEGEYWYDTSTDKIWLCVSVNNGTPLFHSDYLTGMFLLWNSSTGQLLLYTNYGSNPSSIVIYQ